MQRTARIFLVASFLAVTNSFSSVPTSSLRRRHYCHVSVEGMREPRDGRGDSRSSADIFSMHLSASATATGDDSDGTDNDNNKSILERAFENLQMPWDGDGASSQSPKQGQQRWQLQSSITKSLSTQAATRKSRETRVPRYSNALHHYDVENYVQSADIAAKPTKVNYASGNDSSTSDNFKSGKFWDAGNKKLDRLRPSKIGIVLIYHGSKRWASNEHLHLVARFYQSVWDELLANKEKNSEGERDDAGGGNPQVVVRAVYLEIASPSILAALRRLVAKDEVTEVICVPCFLIPGKHTAVDVPSMIKKATDVLDEEGLLHNEDGTNRWRGVVILSSKALGSNMWGMIGAVDDLVRTTLNHRGRKYWVNALPGTSGDDNGVCGSLQDTFIIARKGGDSPGTEREIRKYANRVTLLENVLKTKVERLNIMTNRAVLMEDALMRVQKNSEKEEENAPERGIEEQRFSERIAHLTDIIDTICEEKEELGGAVKSSELQKMEMVKEHSATVARLKAKLALAEQELYKTQGEKALELHPVEKKKSHNNEELRQKLNQHQQEIQELKTQLMEMLDAYSELEQLQNDAEATILWLKVQLETSRKGYQSSLKSEQEEKQRNKAKWMEIECQLEKDSAQLQWMLDNSTTKYKVLMDEFKRKHTALDDVLSSMKNSTKIIADLPDVSLSMKTKEGWLNLQKEFSRMKAAKADATTRVRELKSQLRHQEEQHKTSTSRIQEQHQQLQQCLRAQLSTSYETIRNQTSQIDHYQCQIDYMKARHEESMLIAANSVEASKRRENCLFANIEELENDLGTITKERDDAETQLEELQALLGKREKDAVAVIAPTTTVQGKPSDKCDDSSSCQSLAQCNKDLAMEIESLRRKVDDVSQEKERILLRKARIEMEAGQLLFVPRRLRDMIAMILSSDNNVISNRGKPKRGQQLLRLLRSIMRPWTLFQKQHGNDKLSH